MYVNFLSTYSDKKSCHTSTTLQTLETSIARFVAGLSAIAELLVLFVRSTISRQPAARFKPSFACGRILVPNVSSPVLGVSGPWRTEKGGNEIFVTMRVNGNFCILAVFERYHSNALSHSHQILLV